MKEHGADFYDNLFHLPMTSAARAWATNPAAERNLLTEPWAAFAHLSCLRGAILSAIVILGVSVIVSRFDFLYFPTLPDCLVTFLSANITTNLAVSSIPIAVLSTSTASSARSSGETFRSRS